jgi:hypothetical protein
MRIFKPTLIGATLLLGAVSVYLSAALVAERKRAHDAAQHRVAEESHLKRGRDAERPPLTAPATADQQPARSAVSTPKDQAEASRRTTSYAQPAGRLRSITEPASRARLRIRDRERQRDENPGLASELGLSSDDADELFTILAEQALRNQERRYRNQIAGRREFIDGKRLDVATIEELTALLGTDKVRAVQEYRDLLPERRRVDALNERLDRDAALTASEAHQLTEAMRIERAAFEAEVRQFGPGIRHDTGFPEDAGLQSADRAARLRFADAHAARAEGFYARIRERASAFLTPLQMQRLKQVQDEKMAYTHAGIVRARYVDGAQEALREARAAARSK